MIKQVNVTFVSSVQSCTRNKTHQNITKTVRIHIWGLSIGQSFLKIKLHSFSSFSYNNFTQIKLSSTFYLIKMCMIWKYFFPVWYLSFDHFAPNWSTCTTHYNSVNRPPMCTMLIECILWCMVNSINSKKSFFKTHGGDD